MKNTKQAIRNAAEQVGEHVKDNQGTNFNDLAEKAFKGNLSIKTLAGVSDEKEEAIYGQAYLLYNTGRYREAAEVFRVLIMINSTESKYMVGLAACFHMLKEFDAAISTYMICTFLDPKNPLPNFHLSDCYLQLKDPVSAKAALLTAIERAGDNPQFKTLKERSEITVKGLEKEFKETRTI